MSVIPGHCSFSSVWQHRTKFKGVVGKCMRHRGKQPQKRFSERQFQMPSNMWAKYKNVQAAFTHSRFNRFNSILSANKWDWIFKTPAAILTTINLGLWNKIAKYLRIMTWGYICLFRLAFIWMFITNNKTFTFKLALQGILQGMCCGKMSLLQCQLFNSMMEVA